MRRGTGFTKLKLAKFEVPETVRLVLGRRIDRISETAQRIMTTAACIGRTFTFEFLTALAEETEDDLLDALEEAERPGSCSPRRDADRVSCSPTSRSARRFWAGCRSCAGSACIARVADTLERVHAGHLDEHVSDLAYHLVQAGARERAAKYLHQAGPSAAARLATPEALALFSKAAELAGPGATRRAALRARGELLLGIFRGSEATVDLELAMREAAEAGAIAEEMEALLRLGRAYYVVGLDHSPAIEQSLNALERARQLAVQLGDRRGEVRALIPTHRHVDFNPDFATTGAAANAQRALEIARELATRTWRWTPCGHRTGWERSLPAARVSKGSPTPWSGAAT